MVIQFHGEFPRQLESRDKAVDGGVLHDAVLCVDDLEHQPTLGFLQCFDERLVALFDFLLCRRDFRWDVKAAVHCFEQFVFHALASLQHKHIPHLGGNSY